MPIKWGGGKMMERCQKGLTRAELTISTKHTFKYN
jgi:hypothetical protein